MTVKNALAGVAVTDLTVSKDWYQKLFGREPDTNPMDGLFQWALPTGEWIRLFASKSLAGSSSVTLVEDDFGKRLKDLRAARYEIKKLVDSDSSSKTSKNPSALLRSDRQRVYRRPSQPKYWKVNCCRCLTSRP